MDGAHPCGAESGCEEAALVRLRGADPGAKPVAAAAARGPRRPSADRDDEMRRAPPAAPRAASSASPSDVCGGSGCAETCRELVFVSGPTTVDDSARFWCYDNFCYCWNDIEIDYVQPSPPCTCDP